MRSAEHLFYIKWGSLGLLTIGVGGIVTGLSSIVGSWRETEHPDVGDEWDDGTPSEPSPVPSSVKNGYEYGGVQTLSNLEYQGKALSWSFFLWWGAITLLFGIILYRPAPSPLALDGVALLAFVIIVLVGMVGIHEGLHGIVAYMYGADVSFGLAASGPFTQYVDVVLSRRQNIMILAAPLLVLTPASIAAALFVDGLLVYAGVTILLFNTALSCGDLFQIGQKLHLAPGARVYYPTNGPIHVYYPEGQFQKALLTKFATVVEWVAAPFKIPLKGKQDK